MGRMTWDPAALQYCQYLSLSLSLSLSLCMYGYPAVPLLGY
jgi:hypothetical protein